MNPCPCGYLGDAGGQCRCTPDQVARYRGRISGPLLDRIDLQLFVPRVAREQLLDAESAAESSSTVRTRVSAARRQQLLRQQHPNARLGPRELERHCRLNPETRELLEQAMSRLQLSARGVHRVLRVSRTIADLADATSIEVVHLAEALRYRELDRATASA